MSLRLKTMKKTCSTKITQNFDYKNGEIGRKFHEDFDMFVLTNIINSILIIIFMLPKIS